MNDFALKSPRALVEVSAGRAGSIQVGLEVLEVGDGTECECVVVRDTTKRIRIDVRVDDAAEVARLIEKALQSGNRRRARKGT